LLLLHRMELLLPRLDERELQRLPPQPESGLARLSVVGLAAVVAQVGLQGGRGGGEAERREKFSKRESGGLREESWRGGAYGASRRQLRGGGAPAWPATKPAWTPPAGSAGAQFRAPRPYRSHPPPAGRVWAPPCGY
jgi:hypothetical protein